MLQKKLSRGGSFNKERETALSKKRVRNKTRAGAVIPLCSVYCPAPSRYVPYTVFD